MMNRYVPMIACGLSLPALLYLALSAAAPRITAEPDRWLRAFQTVHPDAQLHSTSRELGNHYMHPRVRKVLRDGAFPEASLRSYRVLETPVQVVTFPPNAPLDKLIGDGEGEYRNEKFRTRRYRLFRSGRHLLIIRTLTAGSPTGRQKVPDEVLRKIKIAFQKEAPRREHRQD